jgi:hypothetical protein
MLRAALVALRRTGSLPQPLPECDGESCAWSRRVAECLTQGICRRAVVFCSDPALCCCVANKVPGVRAVAVGSLPQAQRAIDEFGANLLAVELARCTYYECRALLLLCQDCENGHCPPGVADVLGGLDGHAHR